MLAWQSPEQLLASLTAPIDDRNLQEPRACYRVPAPGQQVVVNGMRRRPELNGARGEIVSSDIDEYGRVTVRVYDGADSSRKMMIQCDRLLNGSTSSPALPSAAAQPDRGLARIASRVGSTAGSRPLGSAIGATARSALSGQQGQRPPSGRSSLSALRDALGADTALHMGT